MQTYITGIGADFKKITICLTEYSTYRSVYVGFDEWPTSVDKLIEHIAKTDSDFAEFRKNNSFISGYWQQIDKSDREPFPGKHDFSVSL
jgi:hypothetical protein